MANTQLTQTGAQVQADLNLLDSNSATLGQVLTANGSGGCAWANASAGMENPMTTAGDIIYGGADGVPTRLAKGTAGQVLAMNSGAAAPEWTTLSTGSVPTATISLSQVVSQDPLLIQLTPAQYNIFSTNKQVLIDLSALGASSVVWNYQGQDSSALYFSAFTANANDDIIYSYIITIDKSDYEAGYRYYDIYIPPYVYPQDLTANTAGTLDATAWGNLKTNHTATISSPTMTGLDSDYDDVRIKLSINSVNYTVKLSENTSSTYSGLFFIEESTNLYEITVYYNGTNIILRCATVY